MTSPSRNAPAGNPLAEALLLGYLLSHFGGYGRRLAPMAFDIDARGTQGLFAPGAYAKGGSGCMDYSELFQFCLVIIGVINICIALVGKKK